MLNYLESSQYINSFEIDYTPKKKDKIINPLEENLGKIFGSVG